MSAIALFTKIKIADIPAIRDAAVPKKRFFGGFKDTYHEVLSSRSVSVIDYSFSGYTFAVLLPYLESRGIDLMKSEYDAFATTICEKRGCSAFVLSAGHKRFLSALADTNFDQAQLQKYHEEFTERKEQGWGQAMFEGIRALRQAIESVDEESVVLLSIV